MSVVIKDDPDDSGLDFSADALLPEEASPYDPSIENRHLLYVQILAESLAPRAGLAYEVSGAGLDAPRSGITDDNGELLIDDCGAGTYSITVDGQSFAVHTLSQLDLDQEGAAYRVVL